MSSMDDQNDIDAPFEGTFHIIPIYSPALIRPRPHLHFKANTRVCRTDAVPRAALSLPLSPSSPSVHQSPSRTSSLASLPPTRSSPSVRSHVAMSLPLLCRRPSTLPLGALHGMGTLQRLRWHGPASYYGEAPTLITHPHCTLCTRWHGPASYCGEAPTLITHPHCTHCTMTTRLHLPRILRTPRSRHSSYASAPTPLASFPLVTPTTQCSSPAPPARHPGRIN